MSGGKKSDELSLTIVKKIKKGGHGHHGGAWKVAYADFVTAMMAFFLLLWLLNVTTSEQKNAISNYFDPTHPKVSKDTSGAGGVLGGVSISQVGAMTSTVQPVAAPQVSGSVRTNTKTGEQESANPDSEAAEAAKKLEAQLRAQEDEAFNKAKAEMEKALAESPALAELAKHLMIDITPEGLRIQIVDQDGDPMFPSGSAEMFPKTRQLLDLAAKAIKPMPNQVSVRGHTDAVQYAADATYTNWELSADRANASRRALQADQIPQARLQNVMGLADRDPLLADKPTDARNRRITILLLRETLREAVKRGAFGPNLKPEVRKEIEEKPTYDIHGYDRIPGLDKTDGSFQKTPGAVYFP
jgi:chemotaxis protein MotB